MSTPRHILLVDDEPRFIAPYADELRDAGFRVDVVEDAARAAALIEEAGAALSCVILDVMMPPASRQDASTTSGGLTAGLQLVSRMHQWAPTVPVVLFTNAHDIGASIPERESPAVVRVVRKSEALPFELVELVTELVRGTETDQQTAGAVT